MTYENNVSEPRELRTNSGEEMKEPRTIYPSPFRHIDLPYLLQEKATSNYWARQIGYSQLGNIEFYPSKASYTVHLETDSNYWNQYSQRVITKI